MLKDRLKTIRTALKISSAEKLANELKIEPYKIKDMESGKTKSIKPELAEKIEEKFHISGWWIVTGKGEMFLKDKKISTNEVISLNFYPEVYAAAGYGAVNTNITPTTMEIGKQFLDQLIEVRRYDQLDVIRVYGDSMEPYISNGEFVIIEKNSEAKNGETVIANINGEIYIKKYKADPFKQWVKLISDNGSYDDIHIDGKNLELLNIVGIVRAKIKPF